MERSKSIWPSVEASCGEGQPDWWSSHLPAYFPRNLSTPKEKFFPFIANQRSDTKITSLAKSPSMVTLFYGPLFVPEQEYGVLDHRLCRAIATRALRYIISCVGMDVQNCLYLLAYLCFLLGCTFIVMDLGYIDTQMSHPIVVSPPQLLPRRQVFGIVPENHTCKRNADISSRPFCVMK